jgi:Aldo/keto reductase family
VPVTRPSNRHGNGTAVSEKGSGFGEEPKVRIHLPPAASHQRTGLGELCGPACQIKQAAVLGISRPAMAPVQVSEKNLGLRSALEAIARGKDATLAQLSIAWPLAQGSRLGAFIVPIPGAKSRKHLEENMRAAEIVLTANDLAEIDRVVPPGAASGTRYPIGQMRRLNL